MFAPPPIPDSDTIEDQLEKRQSLQMQRRHLGQTVVMPGVSGHISECAVRLEPICLLERSMRRTQDSRQALHIMCLLVDLGQGDGLPLLGAQEWRWWLAGAEHERRQWHRGHSSSQSSPNKVGVVLVHCAQVSEARHAILSHHQRVISLGVHFPARCLLMAMQTDFCFKIELNS